MQVCISHSDPRALPSEPQIRAGRLIVPPVRWVFGPDGLLVSQAAHQLFQSQLLFKRIASLTSPWLGTETDVYPVPQLPSQSASWRHLCKSSKGYLASLVNTDPSEDKDEAG